MGGSKESREIIAKYRNFDAKAFRLLKKMTDLESVDYATDDTALHRESMRLCEDIEDLLFCLRQNTQIHPNERSYIRTSIKPSLRHWIHMIRSRWCVMGELRQLEEKAAHEHDRRQPAQPSPQ